MDRTASKITNMTDGDPVRIILTFAVPLFIGNIFQQIYSLVDTIIAGHFLGDAAIAAIGATGVLYSLLMNLAWGLNNGYCVVLSRLFGGGDKERFRSGAAAMIKLNLGIGALLTVVSVLFLKPAMRLLLTPTDVFDQSYLYIVIILGGMLTTIAYNGCAGFLRAMSRVGRCIDNGPMEGFWGILKRECYYGKRFNSKHSLIQTIESYIRYYNCRRVQRNLGVLTPVEKYTLAMAA